jgi:hypothetical protein
VSIMPVKKISPAMATGSSYLRGTRENPATNTYRADSTIIDAIRQSKKDNIKGLNHKAVFFFSKLHLITLIQALCAIEI